MSRVASLVRDRTASSCFFRSSVVPPYRKALVQITERCNLRCAHCFVSAGVDGDDMPLDVITRVVVPRLRQCHVTRVTLTGGEPFMHPDVIAIARAFRDAGMPVGICTNGTVVSRGHIAALAEMGDVHLNVSLDGFRRESHGRFRGDFGAFDRAVSTMQQLGCHGLLQGLLVTPNELATTDEYAMICRFAADCGATYVLLNPLSAMGRGVASRETLAASWEMMEAIREVTLPLSTAVQVVYVRFPNSTLPLGHCEAGRIIYFFTHGEAAICPYLIFAARTPGSQHAPEEFIAGNIVLDDDISDRLDQYELGTRYQLGHNPTCNDCRLNATCGKGCPAAVVASGQAIGGVDREVCPMESRAG